MAVSLFDRIEIDRIDVNHYIARIIHYDYAGNDVKYDENVVRVSRNELINLLNCENTIPPFLSKRGINENSKRNIT